MAISRRPPRTICLAYRRTMREALSDEGGNQWPSVAISGHQWPSVAISGDQWRSVAISGKAAHLLAVAPHDALAHAAHRASDAGAHPLDHSEGVAEHLRMAEQLA